MKQGKGKLAYLHIAVDGAPAGLKSLRGGKWTEF